MSSIVLSVVIVNYKVPYLLEQCLLSVRSAMHDIQGEVFVVDNDSQDGSVEYLEPKFPEVHFIANSDNVGFSKANNQAIRLCRGKYVLLLNPDTVVGESTFANCLEFLEQHPDVGALGVGMINIQGDHIFESKRGLPTPWVSLCRMMRLERLFPNSKHFNRYYWGHKSFDEVCLVEVLCGAYMMMRNDVLKEVGLLDETFFMYGEDIDLSYRIMQTGYKNYYLPTPMIHYKGEAESKSANKRRYVNAFYGAMEIYYKKHAKRRGMLYWIVMLGIRVKKALAMMLPVKTKQPIDGMPQLVEVFPSDNPQLDGVQDGQDLLVNTDLCSYDQLFQTMKRCSARRFTYHLYNSTSGRVVSPSR